jgi:TolA-binding protein
LTLAGAELTFAEGGRMKDIHEVLRRKQARYAQLTKQIEALQQAAEKLREVAPLLVENEEEDNTVLAEAEEQGNSMAARAGSASSSVATPAAKPAARAPRWP